MSSAACLISAIAYHYPTVDLATHCRLLLHDRPKHTLRWRWLVLYPLYILAEVAIIATDLAELLGSAIALNLLFPRLPLWAGVLVTASDVLFLLAMRNPLGAQPVRMFEIIVAALVCFMYSLYSAASTETSGMAGLHRLNMHGHYYL